MSSWSDGYVSDIDYTYGYYAELNPHRMVMPLLMAGLATPNVLNACELGFGQGLSTNINATAGRAKWFSTDFNPSHANFAQHISDISHNGALVVDQGFNEFCVRDDLPEFDFIGLHGIWSWISDENRAIIVDFVRRKLKVGGVLYISYNTLPGWAAPSPLRHLLSEYDDMMTTLAGNSLQKIRDGIDFAEKVFAHSPNLNQNAPGIKGRLEDLKSKDLHYIAHEYLNRSWQPMYFSEIQKWLEPAKLTYACSANYLEDFPEVLYTAEQKQLMASISDPSFAQTVKDFMLNTQFRKDFWIKGARRLNRSEQRSVWEKLRVLLDKPRHLINMKLVRQQSVDINESLLNPLLDVLEDHRIHSVKDILETLKDKLDEQVIFTLLTLLEGQGAIVLVQDEQVIEQARHRCKAFNHYVLQQFYGSEAKVRYFASPITGAAYHFDTIYAYFLLAHSEGLKQDKWIDFAQERLRANSLSLTKEGKSLNDPKEEYNELKRLYEVFVKDHFASFERLGII